MSNEEKEKLTPSQYFDYLKGAKKKITLDILKESFDVFVVLAEKYKRTGQIESLKKLCFLSDALVKEEKLIELGITTYVYRDVIEDYIKDVSNDTVKIIELSRYMREIPDDLVSTIETVKDIFDEIYVVFTDYTGREERKVEKERRDKDPILFGAFKEGEKFVSDRFYFLGDWVDEYCDLTLDKVVEEFTNAKKHTPTNTIIVPKTPEELRDLMKSYKENVNKGSHTLINSIDGQNLSTPIYINRPNEQSSKRSFIDRVRSVLKK